jgi:hypothetical protein
MHKRFWWESQKEAGHKENRYKWEDNIKTDLREKGWSGMYWICLFQIEDQTQALVNTVTGSVKCWGILE